MPKSSKSSKSKIQKGNKNKKTTAFSNYMEKLKETLNFKKGGAYSVNPEQYIGGQPVIVPYPDKYSPAIINHTLITNAPGSACGVGGGSRRISHKKSRKDVKKAKTLRKKSKVSKKSSKHSRRQQRRRTIAARRKTLRGGSMPAPYDTAFNNPLSVMTDDMTKRDFTCSQPSWKPECV